MTPTTQQLAARQMALAHFQALEAVFASLDMDALDRVLERLRRARDAGATIFLAGNGGSAATASHWANDLGKATKRNGCAPVRVMCLGDNASWLTALANDEGYERVFAGQLENFAQPGDVLILISASGNSANLLAAAETARGCGAETIGLLGFDGGALKGVVDDVLWLATEPGEYELTEDAHSVVTHILTRCLVQDTPA